MEFVEETSRAREAADLEPLLRRSMAQLGFPYLVCTALNNPERYGSTDRIIISGFPQHWLEYYFAQGYDRIDPILKAATVSFLPFRWSDFPATTTSRKLMEEAAEAGLRQGVIIPIHGPAGDLFCVSAATDQPDEVSGVPLSLLRLFAVQYQSALLALQPEPPTVDVPRLSRREIECLSYCAIGKTSWEVGQILDISEKTVDFHLGNAMAKLGATTRILAVVKAIRLGIIAP